MSAGTHTSKSLRAAAIAVACTALFAALFIGLVTYLDARWSPNQEDDVNISGSLTADPYYVLLIGSDSRKNTALYTGKSNEHAQVDQHADIMTLVRVDPNTYTITLLTVPRDTVLDPKGKKINNSLINNDPTEVVDEVEKLTGVRANYYIMTTFVAFQDFIDALGGVTIDVPINFSGSDPKTGATVDVPAGEAKHLDGAETLVVVRARGEYTYKQDANRQATVRDVERALFEKVLAYRGVLGVERVLEALGDDVQTNLNLSTTGAAIMDFIRHRDQVEIYDGTGPYLGGERKSDGAWVIQADFDQWSELVALVDAGGDPSFTAADVRK